MKVLKQWFQVWKNFLSISKTRKLSTLQVLKIKLKFKTWFKTCLNLISTSLKFQNKTKNQQHLHQLLLRNGEEVSPFQTRMFKWRFERWVNDDLLKIKVSKKKLSVKVLFLQVEYQNRVLNESNLVIYIQDESKIKRRNQMEKKNRNSPLTWWTKILK